MSESDSIPTAMRALGTPDSKLVRDCLKGKQGAWSNLIVKYKSLIYSVPIRLGLSPDDAAEIFQAVCFYLVSELERLRDPKALPAWLIRVAYHKSLRRRREEGRFVGVEPAEVLDTAADPDVPESLIADVEQSRKLTEAMARLSPRCQELLRRLFFDSPAQPYEAIAASLGLSRGSIAFMRSRCLKKLRSRLEEAGFVWE